MNRYPYHQQQRLGRCLVPLFPWQCSSLHCLCRQESFWVAAAYIWRLHDAWFGCHCNIQSTSLQSCRKAWLPKHSARYTVHPSQFVFCDVRSKCRHSKAQSICCGSPQGKNKWSLSFVVIYLIITQLLKTAYVKLKPIPNWPQINRIKTNIRIPATGTCFNNDIFNWVFLLPFLQPKAKCANFSVAMLGAVYKKQK